LSGRLFTFVLLRKRARRGVAGVDACDFGVCGSEDEEDCWDLWTISLYLCLEQVGF
jgi:hypothetical protein